MKKKHRRTHGLKRTSFHKKTPPNSSKSLAVTKEKSSKKHGYGALKGGKKVSNRLEGVEKGGIGDFAGVPRWTKRLTKMPLKAASYRLQWGRKTVTRGVGGKLHSGGAGAF